MKVVIGVGDVRSCSASDVSSDAESSCEGECGDQAVACVGLRDN
jgi:hypothetical protein